MTRSRTPLVVALVLFSAGALGFAWWQHSLRLRAQADLATAQRRIEELQRNQPALPSVSAKAVVADSLEAGPGPLPGQPPVPEFGDRRGGPGGRFGRALLDLSSDPEIAPLLLNQRKRAVATRYAALLARLGLPPAQAEQLTTLLAEKQLSRSDAQLMARSQGLGRDEVRDMSRLADAESDAAIKSLLGDAAFTQLQNFDRTYAQRTTVSSLAERLTYVGAPLPTAQQEQLIQILAANTADASGGGGIDSGPPGAGLGRPTNAFGRGASVEESRVYLEAKSASDVAALQQASSILTPAQLATLQQMQQEENEQLKLNTLTAQRLRQLRSEGGGRASGR